MENLSINKFKNMVASKPQKIVIVYDAFVYDIKNKFYLSEDGNYDLYKDFISDGYMVGYNDYNGIRSIEDIIALFINEINDIKYVVIDNVRY